MAPKLDRKFPKLLAVLHELPFDYAGGEGIDFEPLTEFQSAAETADWIRAWTGNSKVTGEEFRIFGADGTGGNAAFWMVRAGKPLLEQPIVFFGSEGELGVVARNFGDYLWLLAGGFGPCEAVAGPGDKRARNRAFTTFATRHAAGSKKSVSAVLTAARAEFPDFEQRIRALCK